MQAAGCPRLPRLHRASRPEECLDPYLKLLGLISLLFFLPKLILRAGIPSPLTELALGIALGPAALGIIHANELISGLAGFGISSLFLFAGLEVNVPALLARRGTILQHLTIQLVLIGSVGLIGAYMGLGLSVAALLALAVASSSVGFILSALSSLGIPAEVAEWIKQKAVATELMAVAMVLFLSNTASWSGTLAGLGGIALLVAAVPLLFLAFHRTILRWAPGTEFSFVMIVALLAAYVTHHLGVHYLVGAFIVGLVARRFLDWSVGHEIPVASLKSALHSFRFFSAFFVPFFFFMAGVSLPLEALSLESAAFGLALCATILPARIVSVALHRRYGLGESWGRAFRVGILLGPTTIFTIAVAEILISRFEVAPWIVGGLFVYAAATSLLPLVSRQVKSTEYEDVLAMYEELAEGTQWNGKERRRAAPATEG